MNSAMNSTVNSTAALHLKPGRDKPVRQRHPWIMSGAVAKVVGNPQPGDHVRVIAASGEHIATASYSPHSSIRARVWTTEADQEIDEEFVKHRVHAAVSRRSGHVDGHHTCRLVFAESDQLPGLIVDRYGDVIVMQLNTVGVDRWRDSIADALAEVDGISCVYERSDTSDREREGLEPRVGVVRGRLPEQVFAVEDGLHFHVSVESGHKTGYYVDQRDSRRLVASLAPGARVLNVFAYTGSFSVVAMKHGAASVTTIDSSGPALDLYRRNAELNGVEAGEIIEGDAFELLRRLRDRRAQFDVVILDPPKFAASSKHVERAARSYKDINLLGAKLLAPNGHMLTWSCSGAVDAGLFQSIVAGAALDAKRDLRIVQRLGQPFDHPVLLSFPEGEYLKGLHLRAD